MGSRSRGSWQARKKKGRKRHRMVILPFKHERRSAREKA